MSFNFMFFAFSFGSPEAFARGLEAALAWQIGCVYSDSNRGAGQFPGMAKLKLPQDALSV